MIRRPPRSTRTDTLFPYTTLFRSERLQRKLTPLVFECVEWLDGPLSDPWNGALFANEVIDALPTPRFSLRDGEVFEEHVALTGDGAFIHTDRPADPLLSAAVRHVERAIGAPLPAGYRSTEERSVGKEGVSTCEFRWSTDNKK